MPPKSIMRSSNHHHKAFYALGLFSLLLLIQKGGAYQFKIGGSNGWSVPTDPNGLSYNQWAEKSRFQIGDTLLFVYPADKDSVLQVTKDDYTNCSTETPTKKFTDGHTVIRFDQSGPHYFISGVKDNCAKNEKLVVVVLADRSKRSSTSNETTMASPPPSPSPPEGSVEIIPSPAPSADHTPPPSGGSSIVIGFVGSIGAFLGSSLLLVL